MLSLAAKLVTAKRGELPSPKPTGWVFGGCAVEYQEVAGSASPVVPPVTRPVTPPPATSQPDPVVTKPDPKPATPDPKPVTPPPAKPDPEPVKPVNKDVDGIPSLFVPGGFQTLGPETAIIGDSHSDGATVFGPQSMWWNTAMPKVGALLRMGRNGGAEGWAGYTLRKLIDGVEGETGKGTSAPLSMALRRGTKTLIVMTGGNESLPTGRTPEEFKADLKETHRRAAGVGAQMVFIFPPQLFEHANLPEEKKKYKELRRAAYEAARENYFIYMDVFDEFPVTPREWDFGDQIHFTAEGHRQLGEAIAKKLAPLYTKVFVGQGQFPQSDMPAWNGATVREIDAPAGMGFQMSKVIELVSPKTAGNNGYAFIQPQLNDIKPGDMVGASFRAVIDEYSGTGGGLEIAIVDTTTWTVVEGFTPIRVDDFVYEAGFTWVADKNHAGVRIAIGTRDNTERNRILVGDYNQVEDRMPVELDIQ